MTKRQLTNLKQKIVLGDKEFIVSPLTIEKKEDLEVAFAAIDMSYNDALDKMINESPVSLCLLFVYTLIDNESMYGNPFDSYEGFEKVAKKHLKPSELSTIIENVFMDSMPNFEVMEEKKSHLANLLGWTFITLAIVGTIHTLFWLRQLTLDMMNTYL